MASENTKDITNKILQAMSVKPFSNISKKKSKGGEENVAEYKYLLKNGKEAEDKRKISISPFNLKKVSGEKINVPLWTYTEEPFCPTWFNYNKRAILYSYVDPKSKKTEVVFKAEQLEKEKKASPKKSDSEKKPKSKTSSERKNPPLDKKQLVAFYNMIAPWINVDTEPEEVIVYLHPKYGYNYAEDRTLVKRNSNDAIDRFLNHRDLKLVMKKVEILNLDNDKRRLRIHWGLLKDDARDLLIRLKVKEGEYIYTRDGTNTGVVYKETTDNFKDMEKIVAALNGVVFSDQGNWSYERPDLKGVENKKLPNLYESGLAKFKNLYDAKNDLFNYVPVKDWIPSTWWDPNQKRKVTRPSEPTESEVSEAPKEKAKSKAQSKSKQVESDSEEQRTKEKAPAKKYTTKKANQKEPMEVSDSEEAPAKEKESKKRSKKVESDSEEEQPKKKTAKAPSKDKKKTIEVSDDSEEEELENKRKSKNKKADLEEPEEDESPKEEKKKSKATPKEDEEESEENDDEEERQKSMKVTYTPMGSKKKELFGKNFFKD